MSYTGIILDIDGTLLDSNDAHARSWVDALGRFGLSLPFSAVRPLIGMGGDKVLAILADVSSDSERGQAITAARKTAFRTFLPDLRPFPGARALLEALRDRGLELVTGTSAEADLVGDLLDRAGVADLVERRTTSDDADRSKPHPDIVEAARATLDRPHALMLGDTPYDVAAARLAHADTIALRCGGWWTDAAFEGALAIYDDPGHLARELDRSPLGRR